MARRQTSIPAALPEPEAIDLRALSDACASGEVNLIVVLGPTASGKTKYAVGLAWALSSALFPGSEGCRVEIISADSRQVYRGMDIGTGKDISEYGDVPYHLIDIADPGDGYNVFRFRQDFFKAFADIRSRGRIPILCGGTGLYINSVLNGYNFVDHTPLSESRTAGLAGDCADDCSAGYVSPSPTSGIGIMAFDGEAYPAVDHSAAVSETAATELASSVSEFGRMTIDASTAAAMINETGELRPFVIGTLVSREVRNARIDSRLKARLEEGMVDEIRGLLDSGVPAETLIGYGLEYRYVTLFLKGEITYEEMYSKLSTAIHQFAKRQMTWFRGMERSGVRIHWTEV